MGREIRRVPPDWEHPKDDDDNYIPLFDIDYQSAAEEWIKKLNEFEAMTPDEKKKEYGGYQYYWEYDYPPEIDCHRKRRFNDGEATAYQIYETVSDGTPISPVFPNVDDMRTWLISQGYSEKATDKFIEYEWAPSAMLFENRFYRDISTHNVP